MSNFKLMLFVAFFTFTYAGLNQLCELIDFYDKFKLAPECLTYDDYGCWCGPGGSGKPVDKTDKCCYYHDKCYDKIIAGKECSPYTKQYQHNNGTCMDMNSSCEYKICECDRKLADCLSHASFTWRYWGHRFWPGSCKNEP